MIDLPAAKMRAADVPVLALAVRCQDERAFARAYEYPHSGHLRNPVDATRSNTQTYVTHWLCALYKVGPRRGIAASGVQPRYVLPSRRHDNDAPHRNVDRRACPLGVHFRRA